MERKRKTELSALNVLFCLLVIFIHVISYAISRFEPNTVSYTSVMLPWRLSSFVVQGFIMLSGIKLFLNRKDEVPYLKFLKSRLLGIIIPYTICFVIYYVYFMITNNYPLDILFILKHFLFGSLVYHLYFIPLLFQFDVLFPLWKRIINKCSPVIVIPFSIFITIILGNYLPQMISSIFPNATFIYNDRLFTTYLMYWIIGCYIGKYYEIFCDVIKKNFRTICVIFSISLVLVITFSYLYYNGIAWVPYINDIHSFYVLSAIMFLFTLSIKIPSAAYEKIPFLRTLDKSSFYIYLYHVMVLFFIEHLV